MLSMCQILEVISSLHWATKAECDCFVAKATNFGGHKYLIGTYIGFTYWCLKLFPIDITWYGELISKKQAYNENEKIEQLLSPINAESLLLPEKNSYTLKQLYVYPTRASTAIHL